MTLRFGTDGVRGHEDEFTDEVVKTLGRAAARVLGDPIQPFVVGRDPRRSGPGIQRALAAGLEAEGLTVELLEVAPTPAVAWVAAERGIAGAMISASHNPAHDNGIKFFAAGGRKLSDAVEARFEDEIDALAGTFHEGVVPPAPSHIRAGSASGSAHADLDRYAAAVAASVDGRRLAGLSVVLDCANGAASAFAGEIVAGLGAEIHVINDQPDGENINRACGSTHPESLIAAVLERSADLGLAFDGDADRVLAVDATGALVDGDHLIAMLAIDRAARGLLANNTVVVTVMTNLGFHLAMRQRGIVVEQTAVGDRYVLEALEAGGHCLGGEQSGHVILAELATTGDGILTGVQILDLLARSGRPLAELAASAMTRLPQVLENVRVARPAPDIATQIAADIAEVEAELGETGRVLVRPSGTEPVVRVMVEAADPAAAARAVERLVRAVTLVCSV